MKDSDEALYLALDQGGHATRALLFNEQGEILDSAFAEIETIQPDSLRVEHDPEQYIDSFLRVLGQLCDKLDDLQLKRIRCAGLATQRSSMVCWDKASGRALSPILSWQDRRMLERIADYQGASDLITRKTGLVLNAHYGASKMRWCLENLGSVQAAAAQGSLVMAPVASFVLFRLLKERPLLCDPANGGRTLLYNYRDNDWDEDLLSLFKIDRACLPDCVETEYDFGHLCVGGYEIPMRICTGDQSAAVFAQGMPRSQALYINAGTGAFVQQLLEDNIDDVKDGLLRSLVYSDSAHKLYVKEGTVNGAGRALQWFAEQRGQTQYEQSLDIWAMATPDPPLFVNGVAGVGSPLWIADMASYFDRECSDQEGFVAILESIVFLLMLNIELFSGYDEIRISGGLSENRVFCQNLADLSAKIIIKQSLTEATSTGLWYLMSDRQELRGQQGETFHAQKNGPLRKRYQAWMRLLRDNTNG